MKNVSPLYIKLAMGIMCMIIAFPANAITPEEIEQRNYEAEQACEADKNYGSVSGNDWVDAVLGNNYRFIWKLLKDEAKYELCKQLTPKKIAERLVSITPTLAEKINSIFDSDKTDAEKGKDLELLIEEQMSPQYGYANNNKAHIRVAPGLGLVRIGWEDDIHFQNCPKWKLQTICPNGPSSCYYEYYHATLHDSIYPDYNVYRVVNGHEKYLGTVEGAVISREDENINIGFSSPENLLKAIGKDLAKKQLKKLIEKDPTIPAVVNSYQDAYADIYENSVIRYKLVGKDPGGARECSGAMGEFSYYIDYDLNADGIPDFVDSQWYSGYIGRAYAPILVPIITSLLLN